MRTVQMELLRPGELLEEQRRISLVYLPIGPVEWHSYHMPMGTDGLIAQGAARAMAERTGGVVAPTMFIGTESKDSEQMLNNLHVAHQPTDNIWGMDFPRNILPSLYVREEVFAAIVREELRLLAKMGYRMIAIINGHGASGQVSTLQRLCREMSAETGAICLMPDFPNPHVDALLRQQATFDPGHADRFETALMMALTESVDLEQLPPRDVPMHSEDFGVASGSQFGGVPPCDGVIRDDPRDATKAFGEAFQRAVVEDDAAGLLAYYREHVGEIGGDGKNGKR